MNHPLATATFGAAGIEDEEAVGECPSIDGGPDDSIPEDDQHRSTREFEVTVLTTRSGTAVVIVAAADRETALSTVREELASGDLAAPPEQCTDDVQTEIWTIRQVPPAKAGGL